MSKYSEFFLIGNASHVEIGENLRLRKYGSWLAEEAWLRDKYSQKRAQFTLRAISFAKKIASEKNIEVDEAFNLLQSAGENQSVFSDYAEETQSLMQAMPSSKEQTEDLVTVFFRNRGEVLQGKKWVTTSDWDKEDTSKLPKILLDKVELFMAEEDETSVSGDESESDDEGEGREQASKN